MATSSTAQVNSVSTLVPGLGPAMSAGLASGLAPEFVPVERVEVAPPAVSSGALEGLGRVLAIWHLTSLDAPTVAVVWALAFARAERVPLPLWVPAGLALCAWAVYVGDRLLDAHRAIRACDDDHCDHTPSATPRPKPMLNAGLADLRPRHHFHWRHRRILLPGAIAASLAAVCLALRFMPLAARERNSVLVVAALAYFTCVHTPWRFAGKRFKLPKEMLVGILFTVACAIPAWARMQVDPAEKLTLVLSVIVFIALAWLNCEAIERWETGLRSRWTFLQATALGAVAVTAAAAAGALGHPRVAALLATAALAAVLTALLDRNARRMDATTLRAAADLVLLAPGLLLLVL